MCWHSAGALGPSLHPRKQNSVSDMKFVHSCSCVSVPVNALENTSPPIGFPFAHTLASRRAAGGGLRTVSVRTVRVKLAALVARGDVHEREVADACDLHVVRGLHKVRARERVWRNRTRPVPVLEAPRHFDAFCVADRRVRAWLGWCVEAEVVD